MKGLVAQLLLEHGLVRYVPGVDHVRAHVGVADEVRDLRVGELLSARRVDQPPRDLLDSFRHHRRASQDVDQRGEAVPELVEPVVDERVGVPAVGVLYALAHPCNGQVWCDDGDQIRRLLHQGGKVPLAGGQFSRPLRHPVLEGACENMVLNDDRHAVRQRQSGQPDDHPGHRLVEAPVSGDQLIARDGDQATQGHQFGSGHHHPASVEQPLSALDSSGDAGRSVGRVAPCRPSPQRGSPEREQQEAREPSRIRRIHIVKGSDRRQVPEHRVRYSQQHDGTGDQRQTPVHMGSAPSHHEQDSCDPHGVEHRIGRCHELLAERILRGCHHR